MTNKHVQGDLEQMQSLPLEAKITISYSRIREWYNEFCGDVFVAFSGGKDSTVLMHIIRTLYPEVEAIFVDTGLEYPEIRRFVKTVDNVTILRPEMNFNEVIKKYGYPVISKAVAHSVSIAKRNPDGAVHRNLFNPEKRGPYAMYKYEYLINAPFDISDKCCDVMKKKPVHAYSLETGKTAFVGTMACESLLRKTQWMKHGCNAFDIVYPTSQPLSFWTEQDILEYLQKYQVPYASVYGEIKRDSKGKWYTTGVNRTGCMFCMFGVQCEKSPNRFERMRITHPKQYDYCIRSAENGGLGIGRVLEYIGVTY